MTAHKYSRQREAILLNLRQRIDHPTADMVYEDIRREFPNLSLGTVYRNLALLSSLGEITRLGASDGPVRYDGRTDAHNHFVCRRCGAVIDLPASDFSSLLEGTQCGFSGRIEDCRIIFRGLCGDCTHR